MLRDLFVIGLLLCLSRAMLWAVRWLDRRGIAREYARKMLHVGMGMILCSLPWLFDRIWPVAILCTIYVGLLIARRFLAALDNHVGSVIDGVGRRSVGEFLFPIAVALVFALASGDKATFVSAMLVLTLADATAAIIGRRYGMCHYASPGGCKSLEGSLAFAAMAFASTHLTLLLLGGAGRIESVLIALIVALMMMIVEALATGGWDNLILPVGTWGTLKLVAGLTTTSLAVIAAAALVAALALTLVWALLPSLQRGTKIA